MTGFAAIAWLGASVRPSEEYDDPANGDNNESTDEVRETVRRLEAIRRAGMSADDVDRERRAYRISIIVSWAVPDGRRTGICGPP